MLGYFEMDLLAGAGKQARLHGAGHNRNLLLRQNCPPLLGSPKIEISKKASIPNAPYGCQRLCQTNSFPQCGYQREGRPLMQMLLSPPQQFGSFQDAEAAHPIQECSRGMRSHCSLMPHAAPTF